MNRALSIGLLAIGVVLFVVGLDASNSFASEFSEFFGGNPTQESIWMMLGGSVLAVIGISGLRRKSK